MQQRPIPEPVVSSPANSPLNRAWTLLQMAAALVDGAPADVPLYVTTGTGVNTDSINVQVDSDVPLVKRCEAVQWFGSRLGAEPTTNLHHLNESGRASVFVDAELGANRKTRVRVWTTTGKAA